MKTGKMGKLQREFKNAMSIQTGKYVFCYHGHYDNVRYDAWLASENADYDRINFVGFEIDGDTVKVLEAGNVSEQDRQEMLETIQQHINNFSARIIT